MEKPTAVRINKYLSEIGYCRRAADKLIVEGRIAVNGKAVEMGMKVSAKDKLPSMEKKFSKKTNNLLSTLLLISLWYCLHHRYAC